MFVHYSKTKAEFIAAGLATTYNNNIVFIKGDANGNGSCIYTHGTYFANFNEFLAAVNYVKGVKVGDSQYNATAGGGYIPFASADNSTVALNVENGTITVGLAEAFVTKVNNTATNLGTKDDQANSEGSAFARIANLAQLVSDLTGGSVDSIEGQITKAIKALRTEITGDLSDTTDAKTLAAINDELNGIDEKVKALEDAGFIKIGDVQSEIAKLGGSEEDGEKVKVTVTTSGGEVNAVNVDESALNTALAGKANLDDAGKILVSELPDYILGQVMFGGIITEGSPTTSRIEFSQNFIAKYNPTGLSNNVGVLSGPKAADYEGVYFIVQGQPSGNIVWTVPNVNVGDWIISTGASWSKVDNTDAVSSVAGLTGTITATALAKKLAETNDANELALKSEVDAVEVTASGDNTLLTASVSDKRAISVAPTAKLTEAVAKAESAYQKPADGIAKADLAEDVQMVLNGAIMEVTTMEGAGTDGDLISVEEGTALAHIADINSIQSGKRAFAEVSNVKTYVDAQWEWEEL